MTRKLPPLNALRSFEAAARLNSFKKAATELNVTQSAISHQIKHLENALGVELFVRQTRSIALTQSGKALFPFVEKALDLLEEGVQKISRTEHDNILILQSYSTLSVRWLLPKLDRFRVKHPNLQVRLITSQWDPDFTEQDIDLAIMIGTPEANNMRYDYLFSPCLFPVCSPKLLAGDSPLKAPADLAAQTILQVYPSENDWRVWLEATGTEGIDLNAGLSFDSYDHALKTAVRGAGVALAMHPYVSEDFAANLLVNPFPEYEVPATGHWYLVYPKARTNREKIKAFRLWLLDEINADPDLLPLRTEVPAM
ncbi:transcriptional regulator GcvA [Kordiimonas sp.]|uniref:transcriptional regulator GcvA n=1 Tax=Kordiimonas sp. TaxID=1970157 RepID=UPI003A91863F